MNTYKETEQAVKELVLTHGLDGIRGEHIVDLLNDGHTGTNIQKAINYFRYSPRTANYRS